MEFLIGPKSRPRGATRRRVLALWIGVALAGLSVAACLGLAEPRRSEPSFPHAVHLQDKQLDCAFCHGTARSSDEPGMPPPELCTTCHERFDPEKPPERRLAAFYGERGRYRKVADATLPEDIRFSHRRHVTDARLDCIDCHGDVAAQTEVPLGPLVVKDDCMSCHERVGKRNECRECHVGIDRSTRPPTHDAGFGRAHGEVFRHASTRSVDRCTLCHDEATGCRACHEREAPRDHDNGFRLRGHGLVAALDRARCSTCHTRDSCTECHQDTRPRSHRAGFGAPANRHCGGCHSSAAEEGCAVCHQGTPSHAAANPLPADHHPGMNCRMCHGNGVVLRHEDPGLSCTSCHR